MLYVLGFERLAVVIGDLYFVNPDPEEGQEGPEQGVRLELRLLALGPLPGSAYSARPITVDRPIWRADLLESASRPGTLDRAHHHPRFTGWEPGDRSFDDALSADPLGWVAARLADLDAVLAEAGVAADEVGTGAAGDLRAAGPQVMAAIDDLLDAIRSGRLAQPPPGPTPASVRLGWL